MTHWFNIYISLMNEGGMEVTNKFIFVIVLLVLIAFLKLVICC